MDKVRKCIQCNIEKEPSEFYKSNLVTCKQCIKVRSSNNSKIHRKNKPFRSRINRIRARCKLHGINLDITDEHLKEIWTGRCGISNMPISLKVHRDKFNSAQVDKIEPSKGYTKGNVHWVSRKYNIIKRDTTFKQIEKLYFWMKTVMGGM